MRIDNKTIDGRTNDLQVVGKIIKLKKRVSGQMAFYSEP